MAATDDLARAARVPTDPERSMRPGGAILFSGALLFLVTIGFEFLVGWSMPGRETPLADVVAGLDRHWGSLRWIWAAQMVGVVLWAVSGLLLSRGSHLPSRRFPAGAVWSTVAIGATLLTVAYGLSLGSYPPAISAFEQNPELFATARGGVGALYLTGLAAAWFGHLALFVREGAAAGGVVPRFWLWGVAVALVLAILVAAAGLARPQTVGVVGFFVPLLLGLAFWRAGRRLGLRA